MMLKILNITFQTIIKFKLSIQSTKMAKSTESHVLLNALSCLKYWIELSESEDVVQNEWIRCSKWNYDVRMYWTEHSKLNSEGLLSWIEYSKWCPNSWMFYQAPKYWTEHCKRYNVQSKWIECSNLTFQMELIIQQITESNIPNILMLI